MQGGGNQPNGARFRPHFQFGFEKKLHALLRELDAMLPAGQEPDADQLAAIVDLCAWVHAQWIRVQPFANGNGRTARLWANCIAMR
jgi:Fic family protein